LTGEFETLIEPSQEERFYALLGEMDAVQMAVSPRGETAGSEEGKGATDSGSSREEPDPLLGRRSSGDPTTPSNHNCSTRDRRWPALGAPQAGTQEQ
jgi:hypothetical protein